MTKYYDWQDEHQEKVIHSGWNKGNSFRYVLEGAGDVFREFAKMENGWFAPSYIREKLSRIERHYSQEKDFGYIHRDDTFEYARDNNKKEFTKMIALWKKQPINPKVNTELQKVAVKLNLALLNNKKIIVESSIKKIRKLMSEKK